MQTLNFKTKAFTKANRTMPIWTVVRISAIRFLKRNAPVFEALLRNATPYGANVLHR
ncbi:hypothetical protein GCM10023189_11930 [Nibrella saemangeumensis]|uniref:Uncharacterized protein n=1 Tax=Nibrella saemangeumensis TaxID=1084526 RepID=A0ABP8MI45_9BACT